MLPNVFASEALYLFPFPSIAAAAAAQCDASATAASGVRFPGAVLWGWRPGDGPGNHFNLCGCVLWMLAQLSLLNSSHCVCFKCELNIIVFYYVLAGCKDEKSV